MFIFHIIYTAGTVSALQIFVFSLLQWSTCRFRLVANGCSKSELKLLRQLCLEHARLELCVLPFDQTVPHDRALSYLQTLEQSDYFCFMDSDIIASGDFLTGVIPYLDQHDAFFSCSSLWCKGEDQVLPNSYLSMDGRYNQTDAGVCLGSTYFAVYDNRMLTQFIKATQIDFKRYYWAEIPPSIQSHLVQMRLDKAYYDTGKLLNLLLLSEGRSLIFREIPTLHHIGGISITHKKSIPQPILKKLRVQFWRWREQLKKSMQLLVTRIDSKQLRFGFTQPEWEARQIVLHRKAVVARYFSNLLQSLVDNQPLPSPPRLCDTEVEAKVSLVSSMIIRLHRSVYHNQICVRE